MKRCLILKVVFFLVLAAGLGAEASSIGDRKSRVSFLDKRANHIRIQGEGFSGKPGFVCIFSVLPLSGQEGLPLTQIPRDRVDALLAGRELPGAFAVSVGGKTADKDRFWTYDMGADFEGARRWAECDDGIWKHVAIIALETDPKARITQVQIKRSNVLLFDSTQKKTFHGTAPMPGNHAVLDLGPAMALWGKEFYEIADSPVLEAAYSQLGRTDKLQYTLKSRQWCSEFASWCYRQAGIGTPDPDVRDVAWRSLRDWFGMYGRVYSIPDVLAWSDEQRAARIPPGALVSLILQTDGTTHTFILNRWLTGGDKVRFSAVSGNNMGTVWPHREVVLDRPEGAAHPDFLLRSFIAVPPSPQEWSAMALPPPPLPVWLPLDRLAADEQAAWWRSRGVEQSVLDLGAAETLNMARVVSSLVKNQTSVFGKAKALHDWITLNIAYDSDLLVRLGEDADPAGGNDADSTFAYRRSNCAGLARLYAAMAREAGLNARVVTGFIKSGAKASGQLLSHAWNVVELEGKWYIVDCSPDSRRFWKRGTYTKLLDYEISRDHLFIHPRAKAVSYLAADPQDQLLDSVVSVGDFRSAPRFTVAYADFGLEYLGAEGGIWGEERNSRSATSVSLTDQFQLAMPSLSLVFMAPDDTWLDAQLLGADGKIVAARTRVFVEGNKRRCLFYPPGPGNWTGVINGRSLAFPERVKEVYRFGIKSSEPGVPVPEGPVPSYQAALLGVQAVSFNRDKNEDAWIMDLRCPAGVSVVCGAHDAAGKNMVGAARMLATPQGYRVYFMVPRSGPLTLLVSGKADSDASGRGNQRLFTVAVP